MSAPITRASRFCYQINYGSAWIIQSFIISTAPNFDGSHEVSWMFNTGFGEMLGWNFEELWNTDGEQ